MQSVSLLVIGDEILTGEITDVNGPYLMGRLGTDGVRTNRQVIVPDDADQIVVELTRLRALSDAVVISGGMGPTHDDVTRPAIARALGVPLVLHQEAEERIRGFYGDRVTDAELSMAQLPQGSRLVHGAKSNTLGFAVGQVYAFPGVPALFRDLIDGIASEFRAAPLHRVELRSDRREGEIASSLEGFQAQSRDVAIGSYPVYEDGAWYVRIVLRGTNRERVHAVADEVREVL